MAVSVSGCSTVSNFIHPKPQTKPPTICNKVDTPTPDPLTNFTFFPLPKGTMAPGGVPLAAGLTSNGISAILGNHATLQKREKEWQGRADAVNNCLDTQASQAASPAK